MKSIYEKLVIKHGLSISQKEIISLVRNSDVLEIGSSAGYMTKEFAKNGNEVDTVEISGNVVNASARKSFIGSIEDRILQKKITKKYDFIICADVLEHLVNPEKVLLFLKSKLRNGGNILISIPNIACWNMRIDLLRGKFDYQESGLLDKTHLRFYTYHSFIKLLKNCGFKINDIFFSETKIPLEGSVSKIPLLGRVVVTLIKPVMTRLHPNLTVMHYVIKAS